MSYLRPYYILDVNEDKRTMKALGENDAHHDSAEQDNDVTGEWQNVSGRGSRKNGISHFLQFIWLQDNY